MPVTRRRLDAELVRRGLVASRQGARLLIESGDVLVSGSAADKPARLVSASEPIVVQAPSPAFVGRAGSKLDAALDAFHIDVSGMRVIDVGASTGGFTDCLLQRGASYVVALDVGHSQLHESLRGDDRVWVVERCNVRSLDPAVCGVEQRRSVVGEPVPLVVADLSFISLRTVRNALLSLLVPGGDMIVLVKPQFEAGRQQVSRGSGVIVDPEIWMDVLRTVVASFAEVGVGLLALVVSPLRGARGNVEFLAHFRVPANTTTAGIASSVETDQLIAEVVGSVESGDPDLDPHHDLTGSAGGPATSTLPPGSLARATVWSPRPTMWP
jgi:23S rRNA (cytidine1920-2'-O)/16S rRNA (cytidine1409-2'-O)-methyltransferase